MMNGSVSRQDRDGVKFINLARPQSLGPDFQGEHAIDGYWPKADLTEHHKQLFPAEKNAQASGMNLYEINAHRHRGTWPPLFYDTTV